MIDQGCSGMSGCDRRWPGRRPSAVILIAKPSHCGVVSEPAAG